MRSQQGVVKRVCAGGGGGTAGGGKEACVCGWRAGGGGGEGREGVWGEVGGILDPIYRYY